VNFVYYDQPRAEQLYLRYVKEGAAVPFSADFGQNCGAGFCCSARFPYVQAWRTTRRWVAQHRALSAALLLAAVAAQVQRSGAADVRPRQSLDLQLTSSRFNSEMRAGAASLHTGRPATAP
jgi:hypothetical protein